MLFTSGHEEPRRALQKFIAAEINPFVDEWEKHEDIVADGSPVYQTGLNQNKGNAG